MQYFASERPDNRGRAGSGRLVSADSPLIVDASLSESLYIITDHQRRCQGSVELGLPQAVRDAPHIQMRQAY